MSLTWKLTFGFLFALVLQIAQMLISGYFTAQMQNAGEQVSSALTASLAVQMGIDTARELEGKLTKALKAEDAQTTPKIYQVYLDEIAAQAGTLHAALEPNHVEVAATIEGMLHAANAELATLEPSGSAEAEDAKAALGFLDDAVRDLEQALMRAQIDVRRIAQEGVAREHAVRDLPMRSGVAITLGGVVLMAMFIAWFRRQLVIPIQRAWSELERRVAERTEELASTVTALRGQIQERRRAEAQKDELHKQLVQASRRAGMAELAIGVLHNVGNVLNSVNVSANLLLDRLLHSKADGLQRAVGLLQEHQHDLGAFLTTSAQGQKLPRYLEQLASHLIQERGVLVEETRELSKRIDHMKDIVSRQQSHARAVGVTESATLSTVVDEVLHMHATSFSDYDIRVDRRFEWDELFEFDRSRVMQIVMNLIGNAKHAVRDRESDGGTITVTTTRQGDRVQLRVTDNGIGIGNESLTKIFAHGYTTKQDGHGFGLHHSANAATEMGGRLWAESDGPGKGAEFCLELPIRLASPAKTANQASLVAEVAR
jgi:C4-dicarboxylate-specific signal transduction histidine kinase